MTHEREITAPVDLCTPDGITLNPDALGWSRVPLHRANLGEFEGRNKRWDYWAVLAGDLVFSCVFSNIDYLQLSDVWWCNLATGETGGAGMAEFGAGGFDLPEISGGFPLEVTRDGYRLRIEDDAAGTTHLRAEWTEPDGRAASAAIAVALPRGHESLNVVIPWSDTLFNFTSKHQARPATGTLQIGEVAHAVDGWGVLDVGRGRWPAHINWNWGGGAGRSTDGAHVIGLQIGAKWTAGSGFTENGVIVDGRLTKIGDELEWKYAWDDPTAPWHIVDPGGLLDMTLTVRHDKHTLVDGGELGTEVHQAFGTWAGWLRTDDGTRIEFDAVQGFAEEARQRW